MIEDTVEFTFCVLVLTLYYIGGLYALVRFYR